MSENQSIKIAGTGTLKELLELYQPEDHTDQQIIFAVAVDGDEDGQDMRVVMHGDAEAIASAICIGVEFAMKPRSNGRTHIEAKRKKNSGKHKGKGVRKSDNAATIYPRAGFFSQSWILTWGGVG